MRNKEGFKALFFNLKFANTFYEIKDIYEVDTLAYEYVRKYYHSIDEKPVSYTHLDVYKRQPLDASFV